ncbi:MAG: helix-turn-helix transcriptional regulator [Clostridia bacterium]|nr:helix-turn-helix transcriptional regulator [Clostridia bacterium]
MKTIKELVPQNLVALRKKNNLTQIELAEKINYSDKAISRWEKGEVMPNYEILEQLAEIYQIPFTYFFEEHELESNKATSQKETNIYIAAILSMILVVWTVVVVAFFIIKNLTNVYYFMLFVWAAPLTILAIKFGMARWFKDRFYIITSSLLFWTTLLAIYFQLFKLNLWSIFLLGIPVQLTIILIDFIKKIRNPKLAKQKN